MNSLRMFTVVSVCSILYGGGLVLLLAHAATRQQVVMQEGEYRP